MFSNFTPSRFEVDDVAYNSGEQFFAASKARLFGDKAAVSKILRATHPDMIKQLGRQVKGFDETVWVRERESIMLTCVYYKFLQNPHMQQHLLGAGDKLLAEASPFDTVWGIGLRADDSGATNPTAWRGSNLLGKALQTVRDMLRGHAPVINPIE